MLLSARLLLRPVEPTDKDAVFKILFDPQVSARESCWQTAESAGKIWDKALRGRTASTDWDCITYVIVEQETNKIVGYADLWRQHQHVDFPPGTAEISYTLDPSAWGRGYATEAVEQFVQLGFDQLKLSRIRAWVNVINGPSRRVLEKNKFRLTGNYWEGTDGEGNRLPDQIEYDLTPNIKRPANEPESPRSPGG